MTGREIARRAVVWGVVTSSLALYVWMAARGNPTALVQNVGFVVVGGAILAARRRNAIGALMLAVGVFSAASAVLEVPGLSEALPVPVEAVLAVLGGITYLTLPLAVLLFPSGRLTTRFGRVLAVVLAVVSALVVIFMVIDARPLYASGRPNPWAVGVIGTVDTAYGPIGVPDVLWVCGNLVAAAALVDLSVRWSRASGAERLQYQWFGFGVATVLAALAITFAALFAPWAVALYGIALNVVPITVGIAITRHGLYEINRVVSRSVTYVLATAVAVGVYALVVTSVTWLLPASSAVAVAAATLVAAAACLPALRWGQRRLDRRFDRERYDAQKVVDAFGERLRMRVDPGTTAAQLTGAAEQALQPTSIGVWTAHR